MLIPLAAQQADRPQTERSGRAATIDGDIGGEIGQQGSRPGRDLVNRQTQGAGDVRFAI
jgi:hypothetical protein